MLSMCLATNFEFSMASVLLSRFILDLRKGSDIEDFTSEIRSLDAPEFAHSDILTHVSQNREYSTA